MLVKIIDNFLDYENFIQIKEKIISNSFPFYINKVLPEHKYSGEHLEDNVQFTHNFISRGRISSDLIYLLDPIINKIKNNGFVRIKVNINPRTENIVEHGFHTDIEEKSEKFKSAIFYLNNNNGYTKFQDGSIIDSVENRMIFFKSSYSHTGSTCTDKKFRSLINFVFVSDNE